MGRGPRQCLQDGVHGAKCFEDNDSWAASTSLMLTAACEPLMNQCGMSHFDTLMVGFAELRDRDPDRPRTSSNFLAGLL